MATIVWPPNTQEVNVNVFYRDRRPTLWGCLGIVIVLLVIAAAIFGGVKLFDVVRAASGPTGSEVNGLTATPMPTTTSVPSFQGQGFTVAGAPASVSVSLDLDKGYSGEYSLYRNTIRHLTERWLGEPGVRTADSLADCKGEVSCHVSANWQTYLTDLQSEGIPLEEDAWTLFALAGGNFQVRDLSAQLDAKPDHAWLALFHGLGDGPGDRNSQIIVSKYTAGFGLATFLPVGARVSEQYMLQNVASAQQKDSCGSTGCQSGVSIFFADLDTLSWLVINQPSQNAAWNTVATNIMGYTAENGQPLPNQ